MVFEFLKKAWLIPVLMVGAAAQAADVKVAVFDERAAMIQTELAQEKIKELEDDRSYKEDIEELQSIQAERQKLQERISRDRETLSPEEQREIVSRATNLQADTEHTQKKVAARQQALFQELSQELAGDMSKVLDDIVKEDKITLLLPKTTVMFVDPSHDITDKVVERFNSGKEKKK